MQAEEARMDEKQKFKELAKERMRQKEEVA